MSTGGWIFTALWTLIILAILAAAIVWIVSALQHRGGDSSRSDASPRPILDRRLASGELTLEQYRERRAALGTGSAGSDPARPADSG